MCIGFIGHSMRILYYIILITFLQSNLVRLSHDKFPLFMIYREYSHLIGQTLFPLSLKNSTYNLNYKTITIVLAPSLGVCIHNKN